MVERYNGVVKAGLRKMEAACRSGEWITHLPEVLAGMRFLPTSLGVPPYVLAFKQEPRCLVEQLGGMPYTADVGDLPEDQAAVWWQ